MTPATNPQSLADAMKEIGKELFAAGNSHEVREVYQHVINAKEQFRFVLPRAEAADALAEAVAGLEAWYAHELRPERVTQMWGEVNAALRRYREAK